MALAGWKTLVYTKVASGGASAPRVFRRGREMAGLIVVEGASLGCTTSLMPTKVSLKVTSQTYVTIGGKKVATVTDCAADDNIPSFGQCKMQPIGPGEFAPCMPAAAWVPTSASLTQKIGGSPILIASFKCVCVHLGEISISDSGQSFASTD